MRQKRLFWQLLLPSLLVVFGALVAVTVYATATQGKLWLARTEDTLEARARIAAGQFSDLAVDNRFDDINDLCRKLGRVSNTRFTVVGVDGSVWGDSHENPSQMDNHGNRPEIREALAGRKGASQRFSHTLRESLLYVAIPLEHDAEIMGVMRVSIPVTFIHRALRRFRGQMMLAGMAIALAAAVISLGISRRISRPLEMLTDGAALFARGDLRHRLEVPSSKEIGGLARAMNEMARQLDERINAVEQQRQEQEAVLSSMTEGVVAVDTENRIISLNKAAARQLGIDVDKAPGRNVEEVVRNEQLQDFIHRCLEGQGPLEEAIMLNHNGERYFGVSGTALREEDGRGVGAVVVLNDITRLRRLENVRRDFVANVSHELRTPITSIKGFVETLQEGALDDEEARHFLDIVASQADRLNAIVEDLLSLSRLENEDQQEMLDLEDGDLDVVLRSAAAACSLKADTKQVRLDLTGVKPVKTRFNPQLLEQAVVNLIDNAIKYSEPTSTVWLSSQEVDDRVAIEVRDEGCGIGEQHLPRLFERFYRIDKARSSKLGGTGLGLSIVKHIAQAHRGTVSVESEPGRGSTFTIYLSRQDA